jgi:hypothetical protein
MRALLCEFARAAATLGCVGLFVVALIGFLGRI